MDGQWPFFVCRLQLRSVCVPRSHHRSGVQPAVRANAAAKVPVVGWPVSPQATLGIPGGRALRFGGEGGVRNGNNDALGWPMPCCPRMRNKVQDGERMLSRQLDNGMVSEKHGQRNVIKLLLLGTGLVLIRMGPISEADAYVAGDSGKSTLLKQLFNIHGVGMPRRDRMEYRLPIFADVVATTVVRVPCYLSRVAAVMTRSAGADQGVRPVGPSAGHEDAPGIVRGETVLPAGRPDDPATDARDRPDDQAGLAGRGRAPRRAARRLARFRNVLHGPVPGDHREGLPSHSPRRDHVQKAVHRLPFQPRPPVHQCGR